MKRILLTGATDGIGLETAKSLVSLGHCVLLHGRNAAKLNDVERLLRPLSREAQLESYVADLSDLSAVASLAAAVADKHKSLDVIINNAGVFMASDPVTSDGLDVRFVVNTIAPYLLTQRLWPTLANNGRVINLSSAAQSSVDLKALTGDIMLSDGEAYAQSKLALTMWSRHLASQFKEKGVVVVAVNPGSFLGTKMVKDAYGMPGKDIDIGAKVLIRAALSDDFASASGQYFDNDAGRFASPHADALHAKKSEEVVRVIENILDNMNVMMSQ